MNSNVLETILADVCYGDNVEDEELARDVCELIRKCFAEYEFLGCGRNRVVFKISPFNVIKVPINYDGDMGNHMEGIASKDVEWGIPRTRIVFMSVILCTVMEYIEPVVMELDDYPEWTDYIDCRQVGYNRKGQLLAYDFA